MNRFTIRNLALLCGFLVTIPLHTLGQTSDSTLVLDNLIQQVLSENPQLQASIKDWEAGKTRISQQKVLPDPTLGLNMMNLPVNSFALDQEPMTGKQISLMQPFPFPGKLSLKGKIAESESEIGKYHSYELRNQLVKKTKQLYYDLYYVDQAIVTVTTNKEVLKDFVEIAETRYSVGNGLQQDVLRAQVSLSKMIDRELKLEQQRQSLQAQINALVNAPADAKLGNPIAPKIIARSFNLDSLLQVSKNHNPSLTAWKTAVQKNNQRIDLARRDRYPDFSVGIAYTQRNKLQNGMPGYDFVSAMVNVKIPLFHRQKQDKRVQETQIQKMSAEYSYQNIENAVQQRLQQALSEVEKNQRLIDLYQTGIIPQAEESLASSMAGYQNGKVDFLSLLDSEMTLFQLRLDYHRFLADFHKATAEIETLIGSQL